MRISFTVDGLPPRRTHAGRSADRHSPNAEPLAQIAQAIVERQPDAFPLRQPFGITVIFGGAIPPVEDIGYGSIDPIIEVLVDIGLIADERLERWERKLQDANVGERYSVTIAPASD